MELVVQSGQVINSVSGRRLEVGRNQCIETIQLLIRDALGGEARRITLENLAYEEVVIQLLRRWTVDHQSLRPVTPNEPLELQSP
jgi:hypothetical protein